MVVEYIRSIRGEGGKERKRERRKRKTKIMILWKEKQKTKYDKMETSDSRFI